MPTDPKTAFAGVILEISFARFMASMAKFSEETIPPRAFGGWDLVSMARSHGSRKPNSKVEAANRDGNLIEMGGRLITATRLVQTQPFKANCIWMTDAFMTDGKNWAVADRLAELLSLLHQRISPIAVVAVAIAQQ